MKRNHHRGAVLGARWSAALALLWLAGCQPSAPLAWNGYAEGDYVYVASPVAGRLQNLAVQAGDAVAAGALLYALDDQTERDAAAVAQAQRDAAEAQAANLQTGRRPAEVAQIEAQLAQARAQATLAQSEWRRKQPLVAAGAVSRAEGDAARATAEQAQQRVAELQAALRTAREPARQQERDAAQAQARAAEGALAQQAWRLEQTNQTAPTDARVADTFFRPGEWVPAGQPVLSLLPPEGIKARFFVPQAQLGALQPGDAVALHCDGCGQPVQARITRIASEAEYTPPVIYSNQQRSKPRPLPADAARLKPGMPLDVRPLGGAQPASPAASAASGT